MAREMERMILYRVTVVLQVMVFTDCPAFIIPYLLLYDVGVKSPSIVP